MGEHGVEPFVDAYFRCDKPGEQLIREAFEAGRQAENGTVHAIARDLAVALCLGQRGHGYSGERLTDLDEARKQCAKLLGLFGETGPFCYHKRRLGESR